MTGLGDRLPLRAVSRRFPSCNRRAAREVATTWQVTLIEPEWGRDTQLWPLVPASLPNRTCGPERDCCPRTLDRRERTLRRRDR
ncbi:DUF6919 domain-containing protein [Streptomyces chartreusis]|uniref:DUF6919 domain-containing protein n=1 Tax=Streptomyces chartreusis TaxID=1969 RepID=UPI003722DBA8